MQKITNLFEIAKTPHLSKLFLEYIISERPDMHTALEELATEFRQGTPIRHNQLPDVMASFISGILGANHSTCCTDS